MKVNITCCPQCKTHFRVSQADMIKAEGRVRCGKCLTIFMAQEHLLSSPPPRPARKLTHRKHLQHRNTDPLTSLSQLPLPSIDTTPPPTKQKMPWRWLLINGLALSLLLAQFSWFNAENLSQQPQWRTWLTPFCRLTQCQLSMQVDIDQIRSHNLVIRSHPEIKNALIIDTLLTNFAPFEQPFPQLHIEFSNLSNQPVAQRTFTPDEYLHGELSGEYWMPSKRPVHLALEIVDPGSSAINYRLDILPIQP